MLAGALVRPFFFRGGNCTHDCTLSLPAVSPGGQCQQSPLAGHSPAAPSGAFLGPLHSGKPTGTIRLAMRHIEAELEHARQVVEDGARRIAAQERLIARLRAGGHQTEEAEDFLRRMRELHRLQVKLRDQFEALIRDRKPST